MIIVMEGVDASGKATQTNKLAEKLGGTRFDFPNYESATGKAILGHLKNEWATSAPHHKQHLDFDARRLNLLVFQCLQTANRLERVPEIEAALKKGPVVFDRYWASAVVYGGLDGLDREWLEVTQGRPMPKADLWLLLDISIDESIRRRPERRDRYESNYEFLEKVRQEYLKLFREKKAARENWQIIDGTKSVEEVEAEIDYLVRLTEARL